MILSHVTDLLRDGSQLSDCASFEVFLKKAHSIRLYLKQVTLAGFLPLKISRFQLNCEKMLVKVAFLKNIMFASSDSNAVKNP